MSELLFERGWSTPFAGDDAGPPRRPTPAEQGSPLSPRSAQVEEIVSVMREAGNDLHGRRLRGLTVSSGAPDCRSRKRWRSPKPIWITGAARCSCVAERADAAARSAWTRGAGMSSSHGSNYESSSPSARCSVSSTAGRVVASGRAPPPEASCGAQPSQRGSADGWLHTSCGTPTPSKWLAKACRSWSSSANSATATSASHPCIPAGHRQRRDHRDRPRPASADDPG